MKNKLKEKETDIQKKILDWLHLKKVFATRIHNLGVPLAGGGFRPAPMKGVCDIIGIIPYPGTWGIPLYIEVKSEKGKTTPEQDAFLETADKAGALVLVARSLEFVQKALRKHLDLK